MKHAMNMLSGRIVLRLREIVKIDEMQYVFRQGRGTMDVIFIVRQNWEKRCWKEIRILYCAFIHLEKACDKIPREVVYWYLRKNGIPEKIVQIRMEIYKGANALVGTMNGDSQYFSGS